MVKLHRITTRTGDDGTTGLADGSRLLKSHPRVAAYGAVDELNALVGLCAGAEGIDRELEGLLVAVQHDLFDLGADLATPITSEEEGAAGRTAPGSSQGGAGADRTTEDSFGKEGGADPKSAKGPAENRGPLRVVSSQVEWLETAIDERTRRQPPLTSFVLPGGSPAGRWLHLARAVCRRAERECVALSQTEAVNPVAIRYLNRLSDLLFVCARQANDDGRGDLLWQPGHGRR